MPASASTAPTPDRGSRDFSSSSIRGNTNEKMASSKSQPGLPSLSFYALFFLILCALFINGNISCLPQSSPQSSAFARGERNSHSVTREANATAPARGRPLDSFSPDALYQTFQTVQEEYQSLVTNPALPWKILQSVDDVEISMLDRPDDPTCPYMRLQVTLPVSMNRVQDFLAVKNWNTTMPVMDPLYYKDVEIADTVQWKGAEMVVCRKRTKRILTFGPRDFVFVVSTMPPMANGTRLAATVSVTHPHLLPRREGYVRAFQDSFSVYTPILLDDQTEATQVTIVCRLDLNDSGSDGQGGWMPMWLYVQLFGTTGLQSMKRLRHALQEEVETYASPQPSRQRGWRSSLLGVQHFVS